MLKTVIGRYMLFSVLAIEVMILPYFFSKEIYGEIEFLKYTAFLAQFALFGAGTGYIVKFFKNKSTSKTLTTTFVIGACIHSIVAGGIILLLFKSWVIAILSVFTLLALVLESVIKVREKYLLAMSFKPILSVGLIFLIPGIVLLDWSLSSYILLAFSFAIVIYTIIAIQLMEGGTPRVGPIMTPVRVFVKSYSENIKSGFMINISTAMMFLFFYIDRATIRNNFPELLGDYSLSFSIMQLTIVAITTFSYVNLIEFGKKQADAVQFKKKIYRALWRCFILYIAIGICSIIFAYGAENFYHYDAVFETTLLMVGLFGFANVLTSVNAAHLYLGSVNVMAIMMCVILVISISLNLMIPLNTIFDYYVLLGKTYGLYLLFSILSFMYVYKGLQTITNE
jgi:hypothetical protein